MKSIFGIGVLIALSPWCIAEDNRDVQIDPTKHELYIDPYQVSVDEKREAWVNSEAKTQCVKPEKFKNYMEMEKHIKCIRALKNQAEVRLPGRGSPEYAKQTYGGLDRSAALDKANQLYKKSFEIRDPFTEEEKLKGIVTPGDLRSEVMWIETKKLGTKIIIGR